MKNKKTEYVYRWSLRYIEEHRFSNDTKMLSENAARRLLGCSRETVRLAYDRLEQEGLIERRRGSGTYFRRENALTHNLSTGETTRKIGLILQGRLTSPSDVMIEGMKSVFDPYNIDLHVYLTDNQFFNERRLLETVSFQGYNGFIVDGVKSSFLSPNMDCYQALYRRNIPVIFYNNYYRDLPYPRVKVNNRRAAELLISELLHAGHSNIAGIFVYDNIQSVEKFHGMLSVLYRHRIEFTDSCVKWLSSDEVLRKATVRSIRHFLRELPRTTTVVCCNYRIYTSVMEALSSMNKKVPDDCSLVCFDYIGDDYESKGITCTVHRGYDMGVHIASQLMHMIEDQQIHEKRYSYQMSPLFYTGSSVRRLAPLSRANCIISTKEAPSEIFS